MFEHRSNRIRKSMGDRAFLTINYFLLCILFVIVVYPILFVLIASVSDSVYVNSGKLLLWPKGFHLSGYKYVLKEQRIWTGYANTLLYVFSSAIVGVTMSMMAGYALSIKTLPFRKAIMGIMVFTMYFGGGLIPCYLIVKSLGLLNTRTIVILFGAFSVYNTILARTFITSSIPTELLESASIDGCGYGMFFFKIAVPLSKAIMAVLSLYIMVGQWNSYMTALVYLQSNNKRPLSLFLREILLISGEEMAQATQNADDLAEYQRLLAVIKYAIIVVSTAPIMCIYPFLQKYFVKGVMIGSLKG